jgi:hypothetical protein
VQFFFLEFSFCYLILLTAKKSQQNVCGCGTETETGNMKAGERNFTKSVTVTCGLRETNVHGIVDMKISE